MLPMAVGLGEAGSQTAPLGRAVIGGLTGSILRLANDRQLGYAALP
jgi:hypothetical protein